MTLIALILSQKSQLFQKLRSRIACTSCFLGFMTFIISGAVVFLIFESDPYDKAQREVSDAKIRILKKYPNITDEALEDFLEELRGIGIRGLPNRDGKMKKFELADSFFFVVTLLTTIGYGHFTPKTIPGKVICMIFTTIGIPLTLIVLASYVDKLVRASERYKALLFRLYHGKIGNFYIRFMHVASLMSIIVLICFILPAAFFVNFEKKWEMFDGIYFCFISLTTIGLGDMVPGLDSDTVYTDLYKYSAAIYLMVGVTIIMFMMAMCSDFYRNFRSDYPQLPFTISTEKVPINPNNAHSYGSILTQSGKSETDEKCLIKTSLT